MSEANQALVDALVKFQRWCEAGGPDLTSQLAAATKRADEAEAKREELLAMIAVESGHIQTHWASPYEKVGMENMIEKLRSDRTAAESARDEAVRECGRLRTGANEAKLALDGFVKDACFVKSDSILADSVMDVVCFLEATLQPKEST